MDNPIIWFAVFFGLLFLFNQAFRTLVSYAVTLAILIVMFFGSKL